MAIVDFTLLQRAAVTYNPVLQMLPFTTLAEPLAALGINLLEVNEKDVLIAFERMGGLSAPYLAADPDDENVAAEIGRITERELIVRKCVLAFRDHIANYNTKVAVNGQTTGDNQGKKHPLERMILEAIVRTIAEDIVDAMFFATRDTSDLSPMGMFDGFNTLLDAEIVATNISSANGNLEATGNIAAPVDEDDTDAIDKIVAFVRAAHPQLRKSGILMLTNACQSYAIDALENKTKYKSLMTIDGLTQYLRDKCAAPNIKLVTHECLGTGDRLIYTAPGNLDLGMRTKTDTGFVQVRSPYKDPNWLQFWSQFDAGARINNIHCKKLMVNDQANTSVELAGDYRS